MILSFLHSIHHQITIRRPLLFYAVTWTILLTATVAISSFSPEIAFVSSISPSSSSSSSFSQKCNERGGGYTGAVGLSSSLIRVPLDLPGEVLCLPSHLFKRSKMDYFVPPLFAAAVVTGSAFLVRAIGLWEDDDTG